MYCFPGKIWTELKYLWPSSGEVSATARRRGNRFAQFVFSTVFYLVVAYFAWIFLADHPRTKNEVTANSRQAMSIDDTVEMREEPQAAFSSKPVFRAPDVVAPTVEGPSEPQVAQRQESEIAELQPVQSAMRQAFQTGENQRWKIGDLSGYAVPSPASSDGCRNIRYSVDQESGREFPAVRICE